MAVALGIDLGSTSVKLSVVDAAGCVHTNISREHNATLSTDSSDRHEQDVPSIVQCLLWCLDEIPEEVASLVDRIACCGQMHGVVLWSEAALRRHYEHVRNFGEFLKHFYKDATSFRCDAPSCKCELVHVISPLITWQDTRMTEETLADLNATITSRDVVKVHPGYGCASLQDCGSEFLDRFDRAGTVSDFLVSLLCGFACEATPQPVTMTSQNAASWGLFDLRKNAWDIPSLERASIPIRLMPQVVQPGHVAGRLFESVYGLSKGIPILSAFGDCQCSTYALHEPNSAVLNIGTSAQLAFPLYFASSGLDFDEVRASVPPSVDFFPYFAPEAFLAVAASMNGGNVLDAFCRFLMDSLAVIEGTSRGSYSSAEYVMKAMVRSAGDATQTGSIGSLLIRPTIFPERGAAEHLGASITNILAGNLNLGSLVASTARGIVLNMLALMPAALLKRFGIQRVLATGKSAEDLFFRHVLDIFSADFDVAAATDGSVKGAAYGAARFALTYDSN